MELVMLEPPHHTFPRWDNECGTYFSSCLGLDFLLWGTITDLRKWWLITYHSIQPWEIIGPGFLFFLRVLIIGEEERFCDWCVTLEDPTPDFPAQSSESSREVLFVSKDCQSFLRTLLLECGDACPQKPPQVRCRGYKKLKVDVLHLQGTTIFFYQNVRRNSGMQLHEDEGCHVCMFTAFSRCPERFPA